MHARSPSLLALTVTYLLLIALLLLTVGLSQLELGNASLMVTILVASAKTTLVGFVFMQLTGATDTTQTVALAGLLWLGLLIGLTFCDLLTRGVV